MKIIRNETQALTLDEFREYIQYPVISRMVYNKNWGALYVETGYFKNKNYTKNKGTHTCECGSIIFKCNKAIHSRSVKHTLFKTKEGVAGEIID